MKDKSSQLQWRFGCLASGCHSDVCLQLDETEKEIEKKRERERGGGGREMERDREREREREGGRRNESLLSDVSFIWSPCS